MLWEFLVCFLVGRSIFEKAGQVAAACCQAVSVRISDVRCDKITVCVERAVSTGLITHRLMCFIRSSIFEIDYFNIRSKPIFCVQPLVNTPATFFARDLVTQASFCAQHFVT